MDLSNHNPAEGSHVEDGVVEHPNAEDFEHARALPEDRTWFKHAVFYEVLVRACSKSSAFGCSTTPSSTWLPSAGS